MDSHAVPERMRWPSVTGTVVALLLVANVMSNVVLPAWAYVPWNLAVAVAVVALARHVMPPVAMGFGQWRRGFAWGSALVVVAVAILLVGVALPAFAALYDDDRVASGVWTMLYHAGVRIPFGTSLLEETAFRAVLPALFAARWGVVRGCLLASALFGLWHVLPALKINDVNSGLAGVFGTGTAGAVAAVALGVVGTALGGLWWCWVRYRVGSVLATILAHVGTNSAGYVIAWFVAR